MLLFYFAVYLFANMGIFLVVELINRDKKSDDLKVYQGLAQNAPMVSLLMLLFLLSLGGIPFLAGFWAKLYIFLAAAQAGYLALVLLGALLSVVALFYYLKVARALYIEPPPAKNHINISWPLAVALFLTSVPIVVIGLYPSPLVNWVTQIAQSFLH
jgi:NADH-quinone oxidoreductase subunit N